MPVGVVVRGDLVGVIAAEAATGDDDAVAANPGFTGDVDNDDGVVDEGDNRVTADAAAVVVAVAAGCNGIGPNANVENGTACSISNRVCASAKR
jgi:hypothetical protein